MGKIVKNNLANFLVIFIILVLVFVGVVYYLSIKTKGAGTQQIKIIPTVYQGDWQSLETVLIQDLEADAGFEKFNEENSTFPLKIAKPEPVESPSGIQVGEEIIVSESEPFQEEVASLSEEIIVPPIEEDILSHSEPFIEEIPASPSESLPILFDLIATKSEELVATESEPFEEPFEIPSESLEQIATKSEEIIATESEELIDEVATKSEPIIDEEPIIEEPAMDLASGFVESFLELSGFGVPESFFSEDGQTKEIKNIQLRLSMAFEGGTDQDTLIFEYSHDTNLPAGEADWHLLAEYFLSDPNSNATNNGYWLYGLPIFEKWEDLQNLKIRFKYYGTSGKIFLDAIWLEVEHGEYEEEEERIEKELKKDLDTAERYIRREVRDVKEELERKEEKEKG